uniref:Uncharacterized protein n=1 Tax=Arundo donax TaxID=35708 RepID=A0A0A9BZ04_ARUDO
MQQLHYSNAADRKTEKMGRPI